MVVESQLLPNHGARESLIVELGCDGNLGVGHLAGSVDAVFGEDASDGRSGDLELSSYGSDVADSEVATNDELDFTRS